MKTKMLKPASLLAVLTTTLSMPLVGAERLEADALSEQIRWMQYSVSSSSVSTRLSDTERQRHMLLLERATEELAQGNYRTARGLLDRSGRMLYAMDSPGRRSIQNMDMARFNEIDAVLSTVLPEAQRIVAEKGAAHDRLARVLELRSSAHSERQAGHTVTANEQIRAAYDGLQRVVAEMRSGDVLHVALPDQNSRPAWQDAMRRYDEWVNIARLLKDEADEAGVDSQDIDDSLAYAELLFADANTLAEQEMWGTAVVTLDLAFRNFERSWRSLGIDV